MYTSYIGKKFLGIYRKKYDKPKSYSAKMFFDEIFFFLFFTDDQHLMHVGNSPFFQKPKESDVSKYGSKSLAQFNNLKEKIATGVPSGAIYVGFAAEELQATSSGQLTSMNFTIDDEEMYASWIGQALAVGVNGGLSMLIDNDDILLILFKGWRHYRKLLEQTPDLKDKQIETWNGHWLCMALEDNFNEDTVDYHQIMPEVVLGKLAIPTQKWSKVIFMLAKKYPVTAIIAYVYNLSQTNTTLGFIKIYLPEINELYELRDKIFLNQEASILQDEHIEALETWYNFKDASKRGVIGLKSLEPRQLREFMPKGSVEYAQGKDIKLSDENSFLNYQLLKLWIIAMLNKKELLHLASEVATTLLTVEEQYGKRGKTDSSQQSSDILNSINIKQFIENLTGILNNENADLFKSVVEQILKMPADNFPLFATLIRFEYQYNKIKK